MDPRGNTDRDDTPHSYRRPLLHRTWMSATTASAVPALLTMTQYAGTLAAARCLALQGVAVIVAADHLLAPALWSRAVSRRLACPAVERGPAALAQWLLELGAREPGAVLYPTSDELAWLISRHRDA